MLRPRTSYSSSDSPPTDSRMIIPYASLLLQKAADFVLCGAFSAPNGVSAPSVYPGHTVYKLNDGNLIPSPAFGVGACRSPCRRAPREGLHLVVRPRHAADAIFRLACSSCLYFPLPHTRLGPLPEKRYHQCPSRCRTFHWLILLESAIWA